MLNDEEIEKLVRAGRIAAEARELGVSLVKPGASAREICEEVESYIVRKGASPAFPCNFSVNEVAAHYTPGVDDDVRVPNVAIVKIDVGASIDGYLSDTAASVVVGSSELQALADSARAALEAARSVMAPGVRVFDIGRQIESAIRSRGFKPVKNLTGHTIARYTLHAGLSIPNYADRAMAWKRLGPGTVVAVEPFSTSGRGLVVDGPRAFIYSATGRKPKGLSEGAAGLLDFVLKKYSTLPFAVRWLASEWGSANLERYLDELVRFRALASYPVLIEAARAPVAQFEHTFVILKDKVVVTTEASS